MPAALAAVTACAMVPDQLLPYVRAVSGLASRPCGAGLLHHGAGYGVLVFYPPDVEDMPAGELGPALDAAVLEALADESVRRITVQAPARPGCAPRDARESVDHFWQVGLPAPRPVQKLGNMLRRAARELRLEQTGGKGCFGPEHEALCADFRRRRAGSLDAGSAHIMTRLADYLDMSRDARLFSARWADGRLAGCAIGDFSALATAFYMFAFRARDAPPGTADLLLAALLEEAASRGHCRVNLGLGIGPGIEFFKKKWGAQSFLPCVESSWQISRKTARSGWLARIFGK